MTLSRRGLFCVGILFFLFFGGDSLVGPSFAFGTNDNKGADPASRPLDNPPGYGRRIPSPEEEKAFPSQFMTPPAGYGEVPFWWWTGEKLDKERLLWEVEELHKMGVSGVQVNYAHQDTPGWPTYPNDPEIFTEAWWDAYDAVAASCYEKGMGIGISGYTLDWQESPTNLFARILYREKETLSRNLLVEKKIRVKKGDCPAEILSAFHSNVSEPSVSKPNASEPNATGFNEAGLKETVAVILYPFGSDGLPRYDAGRDLLKGGAKDGKIENAVPEDGEIWFYVAESVPNTLNPLHPESGKRVIDRFFQPFEDHSPSKSSKGLNYFFQDELQIGTGPLLWADDLAEEFQKRKGYSLFEALPVFYGGSVPFVRRGMNDETIDPAVAEKSVDDYWDRAMKYRLDFYDVRVRLAEERYFKPIFDWHRSRGMIYACDPGSRGYHPFEFCDYFSAVRWYSAPGHDTPGGNADFIKNKASASIAHFYQRPRVWLEGYHSLGWGATPERIFHATCENFIYGANLLNLHGLYYSTFGGWWEWAPPCYHFRMPYWKHYGTLLRYFERLSFLMSQGIQKADILIYYPVSAWQSHCDGQGATDCAFEAARRLSAAGYNFFFVDDDSIARGEVKDGRLVIDGQSYRGVLLPNIAGIRWSTLETLRTLHADGGLVVALGTLPKGSDRAGCRDPGVERRVTEIFGPSRLSEKEAKDGKTETASSAAGENFIPKTAAPSLWENLISLIEKSLPRDVYNEDQARSVLFQRRIYGNRDIFVVMGAEKGEELTFRATGKAEFWDPWTGEIRELLNVRRHIGPMDGQGEISQEEILDPQNKGDRKVGSQRKDPPPGTTRVAMPLDKENAQVIVFSPDVKPTVDSVSTDLDEVTRILPPTADRPFWSAFGYSDSSGKKSMELIVGGETIRLAGGSKSAPIVRKLDGTWESEMIPTLDNRFGDFRFPIEERFIGPEARRFDYLENSSLDFESIDPASLHSGWDKARRVTFGFGPKFWRLGPLPNGLSEAETAALEKKLTERKTVDPEQPIQVAGKDYYWVPYSFSWREGIEGNPGHEGFHGLKEKLDNRFIGLGRMKEGHNEKEFVTEDGGSVYYLWSTVPVEKGTATSEAESVRVLTDGNPPASIYLGGESIDPNNDSLIVSETNRPLLIRYDQAGRSAVVFAKESPKLDQYCSESAASANRTPLSMKWLDLPGRIDFDVFGTCASAKEGGEKGDTGGANRPNNLTRPVALYRFIAPPGLKSAVITAKAPIRVFSDGKEFSVVPFEDETFASVGIDGGRRYRVVFDDSFKTARPVLTAAAPVSGEWGGSLFPEPIRLHCGGGEIELGDWNRQGVMENYSGSVRYRKDWSLSSDEAKGDVILDLGQLCASARIIVNGREAGVLVTPPWRLDVTPLIQAGKNRLEIEVCNTLSNHYLTIPTRYRGDSPSGLLGPVTIQIRSGVELTPESK